MLPIKSVLTGVSELNLDLAPGCFGSATSHNPETPECAGCVYVDACGIKAEETLAQLREELGMLTLARRGTPRKTKVKVEKAPEDAPVSEAATPAPKPEPAPTPTPPKSSGVSKKGMDLVRKIQRDCPDLLALLRQGLNPFAGRTPAYMSVVCQMLHNGGFTRRSLCEAFENRLTWGHGTASSHVSIVVSALPALGIIEEKDGVFTIVKE